jgi:Bacterial pre-peptidase C-terminal domain
MTHARSGALALALLACAVAPAGAQRNNFPELRVGQTVNGTLSSTDPRLSDRGPFKVYRFEARQGQRLVITMRSGEFDSFLTLARTVAGITDQIETNDDFGGNTDARIRFAAPEAGQYLVMAQALAADGAGPFTLSLEEAAAPTTAEAQEIRLGQQGRTASTTPGRSPAAPGSAWWWRCRAASTPSSRWGGWRARSSP